jgi:sporulation protein YunB
MVYFEKDLDGKITALKTNMSEVNRLKTDLLNLINDEILAIDSDRLGLPAGSLILQEFFGGKGPVIPIQILTIRNSEADFFSEFSQAGINQTLQKLYMQVSIDVSVLVLGKVEDFTVSSQVVIAETVIVGQVPDMFLQTGGNYELQRENGRIGSSIE